MRNLLWQANARREYQDIQNDKKILKKLIGSSTI